MNENSHLPVPATVISPREEVKKTEVHQYIEALIEVKKAANDLGPNNGNCLTDELQTALENPILEKLPAEDVLSIIDACLNMALPGSPLYGRGIGIVNLSYPGGKMMPAIAIELFPGKQAIMPMSRETAESFEKLLKTAIDEHFGRIIKP